MQEKSCLDMIPLRGWPQDSDSQTWPKNNKGQWMSETQNLDNRGDFDKGWLPRTKLKKIQEGIVGFGCNFGGMIAHLYRSHSPGYTQIRQG